MSDFGKLTEKRVWNTTHSELQSLTMMVEEHLSKVPPMSKVELEEHLTSERDVPPKIVPSGQAGIDCITELLRAANRRKNGVLALSPWCHCSHPLGSTRAPAGVKTRTLFSAIIVFTSVLAMS